MDLILFLSNIMSINQADQNICVSQVRNGMGLELCVYWLSYFMEDVTCQGPVVYSVVS